MYLTFTLREMPERRIQQNLRLGLTYTRPSHRADASIVLIARGFPVLKSKHETLLFIRNGPRLISTSDSSLVWL
jgi:hypothetical protein